MEPNLISSVRRTEIGSDDDQFQQLRSVKGIQPERPLLPSIWRFLTTNAACRTHLVATKVSLRKTMSRVHYAPFMSERWARACIGTYAQSIVSLRCLPGASSHGVFRETFGCSSQHISQRRTWTASHWCAPVSPKIMQ